MTAVQPGPPPAGEPLSALIARCETLAFVVHGTINAVEEPDGCKVVPFPAKAPDANDIHRQLGTDAARALTDRLPDIEFEDKAHSNGMRGAGLPAGRAFRECGKAALGFVSGT